MKEFKRSRVISFGSCMSSRVAQALSDNYGWTRLSNVTNQKVTQFVRVFDEDAPILTDLTVLDVLGMVRHESSAYEMVCNGISSQHYRVAGTFLNLKEQSLLSLPDALTNQSLGEDDLVLIDTFSDVVHKVYRNIKGVELFVNPRDMTPEFAEAWKEQPLLPIEDVVSAFEKLVAYIRSYAPAVKIKILNFPFGLCGDQSVIERASALEGALLSSERLGSDVHLDLIPLPSPTESDCKPVGNYSHFVKGYYRNIAQLVTNQNSDRQLAMIGSAHFCSSWEGHFSSLDFDTVVKSFQRLDAIIERDCWFSKSKSTLAVPVEFTQPFQFRDLSAGAKIIIDIDFLLSEKLTFANIDEVGVGLHSQCLPGEHVETRQLSVDKLATMVRVFLSWVRKVRPDIDVVFWGLTPSELADKKTGYIVRHNELVSKLDVDNCCFYTGTWRDMPKESEGDFLG